MGAAIRGVLITPPSLSWTVLALTTASDIPSNGRRLPRVAAVGAVSVIDNCDNASFTVLAVVHTCWVSCPSTEMSSGRERFRTMVSPSRTESCLAGATSSRSDSAYP
ncbi:Uncharacterised protein [Mycobacteroides abscessus subsp. abscessus]|nr:Uncharacterised protein [Mycobacteroides abscessus subsp. abscessus]